MLITPLPPSHNLVLNKFAIVPEHFILATQAFKEQTHLLEPTDLHAAYACIEAYHNHEKTTTTTTQQQDGEGSAGGGELFVFFNSGPHSGASQPHRHLQLLPVARMHEGLEGRGVWEVLAGKLGSEQQQGVRSKVPFQTFAERISPGEGVDLHGVYLRLYWRACAAVLGSGEVTGVIDGDGEGEEARISYNLAMTRDVMVIVPRVAEGEAVTAAEEGGRNEVGKLALNGTVLAGTALVKTQAEWDALRAEPEQLLKILGRIGVPSVHAPPPV
jgi:ATP adenylyltransferase